MVVRDVCVDTGRVVVEDVLATVDVNVEELKLAITVRLGVAVKPEEVTGRDVGTVVRVLGG